MVWKKFCLPALWLLVKMSWRLKIHETVFHMSNFMSQICELFVYDSVWLMREDPWLQTVTVEVKNNKKEREKKVTHGMKMTLILLIKIMITASSFSLLIRLAWIMACGWIWPLVLPPCSVQPNSLDFQHAYGLIWLYHTWFDWLVQVGQKADRGFVCHQIWGWTSPQTHHS